MLVQEPLDNAGHHLLLLRPLVHPVPMLEPVSHEAGVILGGKKSDRSTRSGGNSGAKGCTSGRYWQVSKMC